MRLHVQASATHRELSADVGPGSTESGGGGTRGKHRTRLRSTLQKQNMMPFKRTVGLRLWGCDGCERCRLWRARHSAAARVARACGAPLPYLKIILFICTRKLYMLNWE